MNSTFSERVKNRREELEISQGELARLSGVSQTTIANIEGGRNKGTTKLLDLARALDVRAEWLESGRGQKEPIRLNLIKETDPENQPRTGVATLPADKGNVVAWESPDDLEPDPDRVWIDRFDYHFSAGTGLIQWEVREKKALPFDKGFFKALGSKPKDCKLLVVRGDSMEPYLFNRDMMMIDSSRVAVRDGRVYAVYFEDEPLVKQIFKQAGGGLMLHSFNGKYPDRTISPEQLEHVKVVGEVIHRSGSGLAGGN